MEYTVLIELSEKIEECFQYCLKGNHLKGSETSEESECIHLPTISITSGKSTLNMESEWCGHGIVRIFKNEHSLVTPVDEANLLREMGDGRMVAMLFIPSYLTIHRLINWFIGKEIMSQATHLQLIKMNKKAGRFMLLMKFKEQSVARDFQKKFNGKKFNDVDPETCHVIAIKELVFHQGMFNQDNDFLPYMLKYPFTKGSGLVELPICPVCLEKLDSEVTGLITTPCHHTFHCKCLDRWKNGNCPVCRYSQMKDTEVEQPGCRVCGEQNNLWICLICGHVGCGRYSSQHAIRHYEETNHCFAMDLTTKRVWDYAGDNYVHRIVQNELDGKLVEVGGSQDNASSKKNKEYHLEYVQVLISQLESQREYYEGQIHDMHERVEALETSLQSSKQVEEKKHLKKLVEENLKTLNERLEEEVMINEGLQKNIDHLTDKVNKLDAENKKINEEKLDLQSQIEDLMFHFETQAKISTDSELQNATLVLQPRPGVSTSSWSQLKKKKKK